MPCRLFIYSANTLTLRSDDLAVVDIEVKHKQFCFFSAVPAANSTHQFTVAAADPPHYSSAATAVQSDEVPQKFTSPQIPYLDRSVVRRRHDKASVELETSNCTLMLVSTYTSKQTCSFRCQEQHIHHTELLLWHIITLKHQWLGLI